MKDFSEVLHLHLQQAVLVALDAPVGQRLEHLRLQRLRPLLLVLRDGVRLAVGPHAGEDNRAWRVEAFALQTKTKHEHKHMRVRSGI